jgi:hypothetical protein
MRKNRSNISLNGWQKIHKPDYHELANLISGALTMTRSILDLVFHDVARLRRKCFEQMAHGAGEVKHG